MRCRAVRRRLPEHKSSLASEAIRYGFLPLSALEAEHRRRERQSIERASALSMFGNGRRNQAEHPGLTSIRHCRQDRKGALDTDPGDSGYFPEANCKITVKRRAASDLSTQPPRCLRRAHLCQRALYFAAPANGISPGDTIQILMTSLLFGLGHYARSSLWRRYKAALESLSVSR